MAHLLLLYPSQLMKFPQELTLMRPAATHLAPLSHRESAPQIMRPLLLVMILINSHRHLVLGCQAAGQ